MLQEIRERTQGWFAGVIISLIILSFALWGVHSYFVGGSGNNSVAEVNGEPISPQQVNVAYQQLLNQLQAMNPKQRINPAPLEKMLRQRALQSIIADMALKQSAQKLGFTITDADLDQALAMVPEFQVENHFSVQRFNAVLATVGLTPAYFLSMMRDQLLVDQPRLGMTNSAIMLPDENLHDAVLLLEKRNIKFTEITADDVKASIKPVTAEEVKKYYDTHQAELMTPDKVSIDYIVLSLDNVAKSIVPREEDLQNYYQSNKQSFVDENNKSAAPLPFAEIKEKVKANYIRQKAEEIYAERKEKLADLAYEHPASLDTAANQLKLSINHSALFSKDEIKHDVIIDDRKVREVAFSSDLIDKQNNSDVITLDGNKVIVIRIAKHERPSLIPLNEVKAQIEQQLLKSNIANAMSNYANNLKTTLNKQDQSATHVKWQQLGWIARHDDKVDPAILAAAFELPPATEQHPLYGVAKTANNYIIVAVEGTKSGELADKDKSSMLEQSAFALGDYEYSLYRKSILQSAKISIN